jgi:hypothetical protein
VHHAPARIHHEWAAIDRRYLSETSMTQLTTTTPEVDEPHLLTAGSKR